MKVKLWRRVLMGSFLGLWLISAPARLPGQSPALNITGYAKNLALRGTSFFTQKPYFYNLSRLRTKALVDVGTFWHGEVWLDTESMAGNFLKTLDYQFSQRLQRPTFFDLDWKLHRADRFIARQRLFRAFMTFYLKDAQLTLGRQRIAWGTGFAWNPTDLLNPFNPFAIEREEKDGVDAAYLAVPLGVLSRVEVAYVPGRHRMKSRTALRLHSNLRGYDFSLMGGNFQQDWVVGGDFAGYIGGAGFRGEWAQVWPQKGQNYFRAILNLDYNFPHDYYALVEFYFNGQGSSDRKKYNLMALLSGETFSLARHYLAALVSKNLTPLLKWEGYAIVNLDDRSRLLGPALTYSLANNLELQLSGYFFNGAADSELGGLGNAYFIILQYYF